MSEYENTATNVERRIGAREHNKFVAEGVDEHKPTSRAPQGLFDPFSAIAAEAMRTRHESFLRDVTSVLGQPYFEKPGFILFNRDSVDGLKKIAATPA